MGKTRPPVPPRDLRLCLRPYFSLSEHVTGTTITFRLTNNLITCFHNRSVIEGDVYFLVPPSKIIGGTRPSVPPPPGIYAYAAKY